MLLERWISMLVPQMEDGNNFGVDVQSAILKVVRAFLDELEGLKTLTECE